MLISRKTTRVAMLLLGFVAVYSTRAATKTTTQQHDDIVDPPSEMRAYIERYVTDRGSLLRVYSIDFSTARRERMKQFYNEWLERLVKLDFNVMSAPARVDYVLFENHLQHEVRQLDLQSKHQEETTPLLPFAQTIVDLEESRHRKQPIAAAKAAGILDALGRQVEASRRAAEASLKSSPIKKTVANRAAVTVQNLRATLKHWFEFYNLYDPLFTWWAEAPYKAADTALQSYSTFLLERVVGLPAGSTPAAAALGMRPAFSGARGGAGSAQVMAKAGDTADIIGDPIGREGLMSELAYEMIPYTPEELIAIANKEFA